MVRNSCLLLTVLAAFSALQGMDAPDSSAKNFERVLERGSCQAVADAYNALSDEEKFSVMVQYELEHREGDDFIMLHHNKTPKNEVAQGLGRKSIDFLVKKQVKPVLLGDVEFDDFAKNLEILKPLFSDENRKTLLLDAVRYALNPDQLKEVKLEIRNAICIDITRLKAQVNIRSRMKIMSLAVGGLCAIGAVIGLYKKYTSSKASDGVKNSLDVEEKEILEADNLAGTTAGQ